jgi:hypothetical protein
VILCVVLIFAVFDSSNVPDGAADIALPLLIVILRSDRDEGKD